MRLRTCGLACERQDREALAGNRESELVARTVTAAQTRQTRSLCIHFSEAVFMFASLSLWIVALSCDRADARSRRSEPDKSTFSRACGQILERDEFERVIPEGSGGLRFTEGHQDVQKNNDRAVRDSVHRHACA
jgi:hypothetical protein